MGVGARGMSSVMLREEYACYTCMGMCKQKLTLGVGGGVDRV